MSYNPSKDGFDSIFCHTGSPIQEAVARECQARGGDDNDVMDPQSSVFRESTDAIVAQFLEGIDKPANDPGHIPTDRISLKEWLYALCPRIGDASNSGQVAEAITASAFATISSRVIATKVMPAYADNLSGIDEIVNDYGDANSEDEIVAGFKSGYGLTRVYDGEDFQEDQIEEKYVKILNAEFGKMVTLTWKTVRYDKTGQLLTRARNAGREMGLHRHKFVMQKLQDVAVTATSEAVNTSWRYLGNSGSNYAVYSSDHTTGDNQTNDNNTTGAGSVFGYDSFYDLFELLQKMVDEVGNETPFVPTHVIVPVALAQVARQLIASVGQYDTANRALNVINEFFQGGMVPKVVMSPILDATSTTAFYVGAPKEALIWLWTQRPTIDTATMTNAEALKGNKIMSMRVWYGGGCGYGDYRPMAKSDGA